MPIYIVTGEKVTPEGVVVGGNGDKYEAETPEEAKAMFRVGLRAVPEYVWQITVEEA